MNGAGPLSIRNYSAGQRLDLALQAAGLSADGSTAARTGVSAECLRRMVSDQATPTAEFLACLESHTGIRRAFVQQGQWPVTAQ